MTRDLPPLNQLRAFEAAARHESIKDGADELCVTPAAVGHQVKALENWLNIPVFHRKTRQITLTDEGRTLAAQVGAALDQLAQAVEQARRPDIGGVLKITVAPFFGNRWLLPRLPDFHARHPGITIEPFLSFDYVDLDKSDFDAALRYGSGDWSGCTSTLVFHDQIKPVCAPQLVEGRTLPMTPADILNLPLAGAKAWRGDWPAWAAKAGLNAETFAPRNCIDYDSRAFMFDAALSGQSVILADWRMTAADEAAGRLVSLSQISVTRPQGIHVASKGPALDPRLETFTEWLRQQALSG